MDRATERELEQLRKHWKFDQFTKLFTQVMAGCVAIRTQEDASYTAGILRLLADELDPEKKGDPRAHQFLWVLKKLCHYNPEGRTPWHTL